MKLVHWITLFCFILLFGACSQTTEQPIASGPIELIFSDLVLSLSESEAAALSSVMKGSTSLSEDGTLVWTGETLVLRDEFFASEGYAPRVLLSKDCRRGRGTTSLLKDDAFSVASQNKFGYSVVEAPDGSKVFVHKTAKFQSEPLMFVRHPYAVEDLGSDIERYRSVSEYALSPCVLLTIISNTTDEEIASLEAFYSAVERAPIIQSIKSRE